MLLELEEVETSRKWDLTIEPMYKEHVLPIRDVVDVIIYNDVDL